MNIKYTMFLASALALTACQPPLTELGFASRPQNTSFYQELVASIRSSGYVNRLIFGEGQVRAYNPGEIYLGKLASDGTRRFSQIDKICDSQDKPGAASSSQLISSGNNAFEKTYNAKAFISANIKKIFDITIGDADNDIYTYRIKLHNFKVKEAHTSERFHIGADADICRSNVKNALANLKPSEGVYIIEAALFANTYVEKITNPKAGGTLTIAEIKVLEAKASLAISEKRGADTADDSSLQPIGIKVCKIVNSANLNGNC